MKNLMKIILCLYHVNHVVNRCIRDYIMSNFFGAMEAKFIGLYGNSRGILDIMSGSLRAHC